MLSKRDNLEERAKNAVEMSGRCEFNSTLQSRKDFALKYFVVGQHDTLPMQWHQCVIEIDAKRDLVRTQLLDLERQRRKIERLERDKPEDWDLDIQQDRISLERIERSILGAVNELESLQTIYDSMPSFTIKDIEAAQLEYWTARLSRQANNDLMSTGRVSVGNIEALRQAGLLGQFEKSVIEKKGNERIESDSCTAR